MNKMITIKKNHNSYAARIAGQYIATGSVVGAVRLTTQRKQAHTMVDYQSARYYGLRMGATDTVSVDQHGMVGIVDELS